MDFIQVVSTENMRQSDAHTIEHHTSSAELMRRAAQGIFDAAQFTAFRPTDFTTTTPRFRWARRKEA